MYNLVGLDQDGTLWDDFGIHKLVYEEACKQVFGVSAELIPFKNIGTTTHTVLLGMLEGQISRADAIRGLPQAISFMENRLEELITDPQKTILPGVRELLCKVAQDPFCKLGNYSGNAMPTGTALLRLHALRHYFDLVSFARDEEDTREKILGRIIDDACERYKESPGQIFVIGDTQADTSAAREYNGVSILVATGGYSIEQLRSFKPDHIVFDMKRNARKIRNILQLC
jgi:phosphoglycolate phosphatase-like HAD superfamily hydrolase